MLMHNDHDVLETCAKTLEFLCTEGSGIYTKCDIARSNIIDQCVNRYKEAIDDWRNLIAGEEIPNEDEIFNVIVSLKKVSILYSCHNLNPWNIFDSLYEDLDDCQSPAMEGKTLPNEALVYCIESCTFAIGWGLHYIENNCELSAQEETSVMLQRNLFKTMNVCTELVRSSKVIEIQEAAFKSICDLLIMFSDQLGNINNVLRKLQYISTPDQQAVLNGFIQQYVFATQEEGSFATRFEYFFTKHLNCI